jgi:hypothetical protein
MLVPRRWEEGTGCVLTKSIYVYVARSRTYKEMRRLINVRLLRPYGGTAEGLDQRYGRIKRVIFLSYLKRKITFSQPFL